MVLHQKDSLEVRGGACLDKSRHPPKDVGGLRTAAEADASSAAHDDVSGGLKDEDVVLGAVNIKGISERDVAVPLVHARLESLASDEAGHTVEVGWCGLARSRVGVGQLPIVDGGRQLGRRGRRVVGRLAEAVHLRRSRILVGKSICVQTKARHGVGRKRRDANVAGDGRRPDNRDALGEDREVARCAKVNGRDRFLHSVQSAGRPELAWKTGYERRGQDRPRPLELRIVRTLPDGCWRCDTGGGAGCGGRGGLVDQPHGVGPRRGPQHGHHVWRQLEHRADWVQKTGPHQRRHADTIRQHPREVCRAQGDAGQVHLAALAEMLPHGLEKRLLELLRRGELSHRLRCRERAALGEQKLP